MKYIAIVTFLALTVPAFAEAAKPAPKTPACGKTAEECQKTVDELNTVVSVLQQQRDANGKDAGDAQVNVIVLQQKMAASAPTPEPPKK